MQQYKGIKRSQNEEIFKFIDTYHILDRDNYMDYLESDKPLQDLVKKHHNKIKLYKLLYNLGIYAIIYAIIKGIV